MSRDVVDKDELNNIDLEARIQIAQKLGRVLARGKGDESRSALDLVRLMVEDVSVSVREALSRELKNCNFLPQDIARRLAKDIDQVAMPFLMASEAVDDDFLESIVQDCSAGVHEAIANRASISEIVAFAICDVAGLEAVDVLLGNDGAQISERAGHRVIDRFPVEMSLMEKLAARSDIALSVAERLIFKISASYGEYLALKFGLAQDYTSYLTSLARRQVFARTLDMASEKEIRNYLTQLREAGGLNSDVLLAYLQNKNIRLFFMSISVISDLPFELVEERLGQHNRVGLARILEAARFANSVIGVLLIAYDRLFR